MLLPKYRFELCKFSRFSIFLWFIFASCFTELTSQTLYLYLGEMKQSVLYHVKADAGKYARKERRKLVSHKLAKFQSGTLENLLKPLRPGDALALVIYDRDYNSTLENRLKDIEARLEKHQIRLGIWLLKSKTKPQLPVGLKSITGRYFDAVSSATAENTCEEK